ncbi:MAG: translocation/assembly module TamB [Muribaculaceae bacterium]|nr:translocation/assembly module TamB [Muribaculaceae bacterium]
MSTRDKWLWAYRVVRSVLFTTIIFVAVVYVGLYVVLSVPAVQREVRDVARDELSRLVGSRVEIGDVTINPFSEVLLSDVELYEPAPQGTRCLHVDKIGAGISIWQLVMHREIIVTYAELIGMQADICQRSEHGPLNIQFLIDAFAPKEKNKPPTRFDLQIRNIVIRKSAATFHRSWKPMSADGRFTPDHITVTGLNADVALPRLSNDRIEIDLRRLALLLNSSFEIKRLAAMVTIDHGNITVADFSLNLPNSQITISDLTLPLADAGGDFGKMLRTNDFHIEMHGEHLVAAEYSLFLPGLSTLNTPFTLDLLASGNAEEIALENLTLENPYEDFSLIISDASIAKEEKSLSDITLPSLTLHAGSSILSQVVAMLPQGNKAGHLLTGSRSIDLDLEAVGSIERREGELTLDLATGYGPLNLRATGVAPGETLHVSTQLSSDGMALGTILAALKGDADGGSPFGNVALNGEAEATLNLTALRSLGSAKTPDAKSDRLNTMLPEAHLALNIPLLEYNTYPLHDLSVALHKDLTATILEADCTDDNFLFALNGEVHPAGAETSLQLNADVGRLHPHAMFAGSKLGDCVLTGEIEADLTGLTPDQLHGSVTLDHLALTPLDGRKELQLNHLGLYASRDADGLRRYTLDSDWLTGNVAGDFRPSALPGIVKNIISGVLPPTMPSANATATAAPAATNASGSTSTVVAHPAATTPVMAATTTAAPTETDYLEYDFRISRAGSWMEYLNLPVRLLYEADINGEIDASTGLLTLSLRAPYIQQGRDKLIQHSRLDARIQHGEGRAELFSSIPTKKGVLDLDADIRATRGDYDLLLGFNREKQGGFYGDMHLQASVHPALNSTGMAVTAHILPTTLWLNNAGWSVGEATLAYAAKQIDVEGFSISHKDQYVNIAGTASADPEQEVNVRLHDIDLDYIFDTLNIGYVAFGGLASGEAVGRGLLSSNPEAYTRRLDVKDLSYNHAVLGDGSLHGNFDAAQKRVGITADISEDGRHVALIDGGIWIGRDSLSFGVDADKVRIGFLQTFMSAFSSKVEGRASGKAQLYGTFKDIDMTGRLFADTIRMKIDYTNVTYSGSDSVRIDPGRITIPSFRLHDDYGHSATLQGTLNHDYFRSPDFRFTISDARNLLVYDTDATMNPIWYGRIFGNGGGQIVGRPGYVGILADMTTVGASNFTFVLSDSQEALDYKFLTFTDRRKEEREAHEEPDPESPDEIVAAFRKRVAEEENAESVFAMDIRATITPSARLTIVMDPVAGDKITAHGAGAMNLAYSSESNDIKMYGKYTLSEGTYNFSLQDLILRDFIIKPGSSISFNGDPLNGLLDIRAAYRVNTNLTDLDKSFSTDHDLNRTNVPVDAMLLVRGEMTQPDITFDIELPTLNDEVAQKVRSIISSEDMMNRQIIYLLALNRFYTPEYMGTGNSGGEWASVASSTLSSQLTNMLGQLTDKVNIAPSLRSDKGDFSDLEVDLALSSRLFNNRLLINGNFGYRDRTSSSTTFIGDFDIEYLLHRNGNFRLKAYNHFNDQNYYLKSALTTQGLGIIYRRDFDRLFHRRRKPEAEKKAPAESGEVSGPEESAGVTEPTDSVDTTE